MDKLPWEQVNLEAREITIGPSRFTYLKTTNRPGVIPLSDYATEKLADYKALKMARVAERQGYNPDGYFVLPGASPEDTTDRYRANPIFNRLVAWLKDHGVIDRTPVHSLRKMAESNIYRQTRSVEEAARFARHTPQVARDHYIARDKTVAVNFR